MFSPTDTSEIAALFANGVDPRDVIAIVGKCEGTGLTIDFGRQLAAQSLCGALARSLGISPVEVSERIPMVLSGGTFGIVTPHVAVVTREWVTQSHVDTHGETRLVAGIAISEPVSPEEIGRLGQIHKVSAAVREAQKDAGVTNPKDVHCVLVEAPALTQRSIDWVNANAGTTVSNNPAESVLYSNDASALGVGLALGELQESQLGDHVVRRNWELYSEVASASAGGEKYRAEVILLGNSLSSASDLRVGHAVTQDLIDVVGIKNALRSAGLQFECCPSDSDLDRVVQVFAKLIVPGDGRVRGHRTTLLEDPERSKSTKCVGGALIASVIGKTAVYISGGELNSHQGASRWQSGCGCGSGQKSRLGQVWTRNPCVRG